MKNKSLLRKAPRIIVSGDYPGVAMLIKHIPRATICGLMAAGIRPQYFEQLSDLAKSLGVPLLIQPKVTSKDFQEFVSLVKGLKPDLLIVNSYSMHIPKVLLDSFSNCGLNIHSSLLPKNRGPNPVQWAIINGDLETGVTIHKISTEFDQGEILDQIRVKTGYFQDWHRLRSKLWEATDELIARNAKNIINLNLSFEPQDELLATKNPRRTPDDSYFSWQDRICSIHRLHRAASLPIQPAFSINPDGSKFVFKPRTGLLRIIAIVFAMRAKHFFLRKIE